MIMTVPERLAAITACLETRILPAVGRDSRSELRAIIKLIDDMAGEVEHGPLAMQGELSDMLALCSELAAAVQPAGAPAPWRPQLDTLRAGAARPAGSLSELAALHQQACMALGALAVALAAQARSTAGAGQPPLLRRCYETLRRHAAARVQWQSIFAEDGLFAGDSAAA